MRDFRDRFLLPVGVPVGVMVFIGILVFSFSRILLAVDREVAIAIALAAALDIILIATLVAGRKPDSPPLYLPLLAISAIAIVGGGFMSMGKAAEHEPHEEPKAGVELEITALNVAFDKTTLEAPPNEEVALHFENKDAGVDHNVAVYSDDTLAKEIFKGAIFKGPAKKTYELKTPAAGSYHFQCDVHPAMMGTLVVAEGAGGPPAISADNLAFEPKEISVPAGKPVTVEFNNKEDGTQHNVSVYKDAAAADTQTDPLFKGAIFAGPARKEYKLKPIPPGSYVFQCDVHPQMRGTLVSK